jgi:choline dehydrogenase-like flavoprotein
MNKVIQSKHVKDEIIQSIHPPAGTDFDDDALVDEAVRSLTFGTYHPVGSLAMGDTVDAKLRVKGVKGLRVVDASVFPNNISGNTCSSVYAIAEKAADMIKEDWNQGL